MSVQLHSAMVDMLAMPYFKNEAAKSAGAEYGHEDAVATRLVVAGFKAVEKSAFPKLRQAMLKKWAASGDATELEAAMTDMPAGTFILQPAGSNSFPDILVKDFGGRLVTIECKSVSDGYTPMWNDNLPKPNTLYVLSSGRRNETTLFMGRDVISDEIIANQAAMISELKAIVDKYRELNQAADTHARGWDVKFRPQSFQTGSAILTNYFTHADRSRCEENALQYAAQ